MDNEFVVRPSACRHAEEALEKIKRGLIHQLACLNESKIYGSYSGSCLTTKAAEVLPEICERPDCPLATVVVYNHIPDVYISVKLLPVVYHIFESLMKLFRYRNLFAVTHLQQLRRFLEKL